MSDDGSLCVCPEGGDKLTAPTFLTGSRRKGSNGPHQHGAHAHELQKRRREGDGVIVGFLKVTHKDTLLYSLLRYSSRALNRYGEIRAFLNDPRFSKSVIPLFQRKNGKSAKKWDFRKPGNFKYWLI